MTKPNILLNILNSNDPSGDLSKLDSTGFLSLILPELTNLKNGISKVSHKDNFIHTLQVIKQTRMVSNDPWLIFVSIFHDIGKDKTKRYHAKNGWSFHNHEDESSKMIVDIFNRFDLDKTKLEWCQKVIKYHGIPKEIAKKEISGSAIRRFDKECFDVIDELLLFSKCDITTKYDDKRKSYVDKVDYLKNRLYELRELDKVREYQIPVDGLTIMKDFGVKPGKVLGDIKTKCKEAVISKEIEPDYVSVYKYIKKLVENGVS